MSAIDPHNERDETLRPTSMGGYADPAGAEVDHEIEAESVLQGMTEGY
jgi:hypothetical protein